MLIYFVIVTIAPFQNAFLSQVFPKSTSQAAEEWAFEETFDVGAPSSPSQSMLPKTFDYVVTHRNHPAAPNGPWMAMPMDHGEDCKAANDPGPISNTNPILQHNGATTHISDTTNPDKSFYICNNHMMSAMGDVDGYSVSAFYPRQEFDFSTGNGVLEFDVSLNTNNRSWWEVMILPREKLQFGAAKHWLPISETYPAHSIVLSWMDETRSIQVHNEKPAPDGIVVEKGDWRKWGESVDKTDPALTDRRIRRKMKVTLTNNKISWDIQKADGTFDNFSADVPQGLPLSKGLVVFKTHAYTPTKDGNMNEYTYHWDTIRFNGPKIAPYEAYEVPGQVVLSGNGSVPIGSTKTVSIDLPKVGNNPVFVGQTQQGQPGQVLLSINGNPNITVNPHSTSSKDNPCYYDGWRSFRVSVDPAQLKVGENTFKWTVGPRPSCASGQWWWDGFAVKAVELQFDGDGTVTNTPQPTIVATALPNTPAPSAISSPAAIPTVVPTPIPTNVPTPVPTVVPTVAPTPIPATFQISGSFSQKEAFVGSRVKVTTKVRASAKTSNLINVEIYNEQGQMVGQKVYDNQNFGVNQEKSYSFDWNLPPSSTGTYTLKVGVFGKGWNGLIAWNDNAAQISTPQITGSFKGEYFNNRTLTGNPVFVREDEQINYNWGQGAPAAIVNFDNFSVRWTKTINFEAGTYQFSERGDDGVRVYIDNVRVYNRWSDQAATTRTFTRSLTAGMHTVRIEYYENQGNSEIQFNWIKR